MPGKVETRALFSDRRKICVYDVHVHYESGIKFNVAVSSLDSSQLFMVRIGTPPCKLVPIVQITNDPSTSIMCSLLPVSYRAGLSYTLLHSVVEGYGIPWSTWWWLVELVGWLVDGWVGHTSTLHTTYFIWPFLVKGNKMTKRVVSIIHVFCWELYVTKLPFLIIENDKRTNWEKVSPRHQTQNIR